MAKIIALPIKPRVRPRTPPGALRTEIDRRLRQAARVERFALLVAHRIDELRAQLEASDDE